MGAMEEEVCHRLRGRTIERAKEKKDQGTRWRVDEDSPECEPLMNNKLG